MLLTNAALHEQCDEARPSCTRCIKSKRRCLGYRDEKDLLFHDQTRSTALRASASNPNLKAASADGRSSSTKAKSLDSENHSHSTSPSIEGVAVGNRDPEVSEDTERVALKFFFENFVHFPRPSKGARGHLELLPSAYATAAPDSALRSATVAISCAALGFNPGWKHLLPHARLKYGQALKGVHAALLDPATAQSDEILMAILLFALIEVSVTHTRLK